MAISVKVRMAAMSDGLQSQIPEARIIRTFWVNFASAAVLYIGIQALDYDLRILQTGYRVRPTPHEANELDR
jgi:hypothetical protein